MIPRHNNLRPTTFVKNALRNTISEVRCLPDRLRFSNARLMQQHLAMPGTKKLHLGCGHNILEGWLNTDVRTSVNVAYLDVSKPFPLPDDTFDYVFTEHMIEHLPFKIGQQMLRESFRVLRPTGKLRITTPDFNFLQHLRDKEKTPLQQEYLRWSAEHWCGVTAPHAEMFVINNFFRNWGHQFVYDDTSLRETLQSVGFVSIARCEVTESEDDVLRGIENVTRIPVGFVRLESMVFEASKPQLADLGISNC